MHKLFLLSFVLLTQAGFLSAQSTTNPYHLSLQREILYTATGLATKFSADALRQNIEVVSLGELDAPRLIFLDDLGPNPLLDNAARMSDNTRDLGKYLPLLLLAGKKSRRHSASIGLLYLETMLLNRGITDLTKALSLRPRPYVFRRNMPENTAIHGEDRASFFSGHTSVTAAGSFFAARVFADFYPDSKWKPFVWGTAATLPLLTGYFRIKAHKHYPSDVLGGFLVGGAIGYLVPTLHKRLVKNPKWKLGAGAGGVSLRYLIEG